MITLPEAVVGGAAVLISAVLIFLEREIAQAPDEDDPTVTLREVAPGCWRVECMACASTSNLYAVLSSTDWRRLGDVGGGPDPQPRTI